MNRSVDRPFSRNWVLGSAALFIALELFLGGLVGEFIVGRYKSIGLTFMLQGLLNLASYFIGGFIIGVVSKSRRTLEPAIGASLCVAVMLGLTLFTPYGFLRFSLTKMILGGAIAFGLALAGARLGEKMTGNRLP